MVDAIQVHPEASRRRFRLVNDGSGHSRDVAANFSVIGWADTWTDHRCASHHQLLRGVTAAKPQSTTIPHPRRLTEPVLHPTLDSCLSRYTIASRDRFVQEQRKRTESDEQNQEPESRYNISGCREGRRMKLLWLPETDSGVATVRNTADQQTANGPMRNFR